MLYGFGCSRQWLNRLEGQVRLSPRPVCLELGAMDRRLLPDELEGAGGKLAGQGLERLDDDLCFVLGLDRMEMGRVVVAVVHSDHDPVEAADPRHPSIIPLRPDSAMPREARGPRGVYVCAAGRH